MKKKMHCFKTIAAIALVSMLLTSVCFPSTALAIGFGDGFSDSIFNAVNSMLDRDDFESERDYLTAAVLEALNNDSYRETMDYLKDGEIIEPGSYSYATAGLQQLLVDFTCNIAIDGRAGQSTFDAVNRVFAAFGMDPVEKVDKDVFAQLLDLYLISNDEDTAYYLLYDQYSDGSVSQFYYLRACALFAQGKFFSAEENFYMSQYADYEERAAQCAQPKPGNGEIWHNGYMYSSQMYLTFTVNSYDEASSMYFVVYKYDGTMASALFLTGSGSVTTSLPGGWYYIKDCTGDTWYGMDEAFGRYGSYEFMEFYEYDGDDYLTNLASGYAWTITVNVTTGSTDGTGVGSDYYDWDSWIAS